MVKEIICTVCPRGCHVTVEGEGDRIDRVEGYSCPRGKAYAEAEFAHPVRILTSTVRILGEEHELLPVRTSAPVPKEKLFDCMAALRAVTVPLPVKRGDVILADVCATGADVIATASMG